MHIAHLARAENELFASRLEDKLRFVFREHVRGAVVLLRQLLLTLHHLAGEANDHVVLIGLSVDRDGPKCGAFDLHDLTLVLFLILPETLNSPAGELEFQRRCAPVCQRGGATPSSPFSWGAPREVVSYTARVLDEKPIGHTVLEVPDHRRLASRDRDRQCLACGRTHLIGTLHRLNTFWRFAHRSLSERRGGQNRGRCSPAITQHAILPTLRGLH